MIETQNDSVTATRTANVSFILFILGGVFGLAFMTTHVLPFGKGFEMCAIAENLARYGTYANPFEVLDTGPTAANPPMYPLVLALLFKTIRDDTFVALAVAVGNIVVNALIASWLPRVSLVFFRDIRPGVIAAILWLFAAQLIPAWDASYTMATLVLFCILSAGKPDQDNPLKNYILAGLLGGASFLFNPSSLLVFLPWACWLLFFRRTSPKQAANVCLTLAIAASIALVWALRNDRALGHFVVRTGLGTTLYASNNDCARPSILEDEQHNCFQAHHPNMSLSEAQILRQVGEVEFDRMRIRDTKAWIRSHPTQFSRLTIERVRYFWFPPLENHPASAIATWVATLLSIPGLILMINRRESITLFVVTALLAYPVLYYIAISDVRYRYPILWLTMLMAGYFVQWLWERSRPTTRLRLLQRP